MCSVTRVSTFEERVYVVSTKRSAFHDPGLVLPLQTNDGSLARSRASYFVAAVIRCSALTLFCDVTNQHNPNLGLDVSTQVFRREATHDDKKILFRARTHCFMLAFLPQEGCKRRGSESQSLKSTGLNVGQRTQTKSSVSLARLSTQNLWMNVGP